MKKLAIGLILVLAIALLAPTPVMAKKAAIPEYLGSAENLFDETSTSYHSMSPQFPKSILGHINKNEHQSR